jgi:hypothetical protein
MYFVGIIAWEAVAWVWNVFFYVRICIRSDDPLYPYGTGVQGTESQGGGTYHPGTHNATPVGDEVQKPQTRTRGRKRKFVWKIIGYTECTKTCGGGKFLRECFFSLPSIFSVFVQQLFQNNIQKIYGTQIPVRFSSQTSWRCFNTRYRVNKLMMLTNILKTTDPLSVG